MVIQTVTMNDLMGVMQDMMQMVGDGFQRLEARMDRLENRMDHLESRMDRLESRMDSLEGRVGNLEARVDSIEGRLTCIESDLQIIKAKLLEHGLQLTDLRRLAQELADKHSAYINDIADILDRVAALEKRMPEITKQDLYEIQMLLQRLVDWALKAAKNIKVPLKLP